ncbi:MAG: ribonuclease E inhibitor RraB [Balneolaceae bacterium]
MKSKYSRGNKKVFEFIHQLDPEPGRVRPVTFWFYSDSEEKIYQLAGHLQQIKYNIVSCERFTNGEYLCIAEKVMTPDNEEINRLCIDMHLLAEKMEVTYDGWETRIDL